MAFLSCWECLWTEMPVNIFYMASAGSESPRRRNLADGEVGVVFSADGREGLMMKF